MMRPLFLAALSVLTIAGAARAEEPARPIIRKLSGGATLVVAREPNAPQVVIEAFFRVGVADENSVGESGLSALLARAWTAAGANRTPTQLARDIGRFGGLGVWATGEYIELWTVSTLDDAPDAARTLLMNLVAAPSFPAEAVEEAKQITERDRVLRQDVPLTEAYTALRQRIFVDSPFGRDAFGDASGIQTATPERLRRFYAKTVGIDAERAVFVVAGDVDADEAEQMVMSSLGAGDWLALHAQKPPRLSRRPSEPIDSIPANLKTLDINRSAPARNVLLGFVAPGTIEGGSTWATMQILDAVMGGGKDCRLFALRDRTVDESSPIGYDTRTRLEAGRVQSLWTAYVTGTVRDSSSVRDAILAQTKAISDDTHPITQDELTRAQTLLKSRHLRERQRLSERASALGLAELSGLGAIFESDYDAKLDAVTLDSLNALAKRVFSANAATVVTGTEPPRP